MNQQNELLRVGCKSTASETKEAFDTSPFIRCKFKYNETTDRNELVAFELSDGTQLNDPDALKKFEDAFKRTIGTNDTTLADYLLRQVSFGMQGDTSEERLNHAFAMLPALKPKDETEAMLLGQFTALQQSGFRCLRNANGTDNFYHIERLFSLSAKLLRTANETMQTLLKYRSGGRQEIQIVHIKNEGQAIIAQNLTHGGGGGKKLADEPHGSL